MNKKKARLAHNKKIKPTNSGTDKRSLLQTSFWPTLCFWSSELIFCARLCSGIDPLQLWRSPTSSLGSPPPDWFDIPGLDRARFFILKSVDQFLQKTENTDLRLIQNRRSGLRFPQWTVTFPQTDKKFLSLYWCSRLRKTQTATSSLNEPLRKIITQCDQMMELKVTQWFKRAAQKLAVVVFTPIMTLFK